MTEEVPKKTEESKSTISRREFLKDAGLIVGGATVGSMALINACGTTTVTAPGSTTTKTVTSTAPGGMTTVTTTVPVGSGVVTTTVPGPTITKTVEGGASANIIKLTVNGTEHEILIEPNWTLRDVLHGQLRLTSVKDMCSGYGACGSCTVIMDGRPVLSCMAIASECGGVVIETAENLGDTKHPLVETYARNFCAQCGYCTPGFILTAKALLDRVPNPTEEDIREALGGNTCRCGTYPQHIIAVKEAAAVLKGGK